MGRRDIIISGLYAVLALGGGAVVTGLSATANVYTPYLLSVGWLALLIASGGLVYMFRTAPKAALNAAHEAFAGPPPREFVGDEITTAVLRKKVEGRTSLQVEAVSKTYAGKWKRLEGRVRDVSAYSDGETSVLLTPSDDNDRYQIASIRLGKQWYDQAAALNIGDWLAVVGRIHALKSGLSLRDGEIVHMGEPPEPEAKSATKPRSPRKKAAPKS